MNHAFDHIPAGDAAVTWMHPDTRRVLSHRDTERSRQDGLVSVRFLVRG